MRGPERRDSELPGAKNAPMKVGSIGSFKVHHGTDWTPRWATRGAQENERTKVRAIGASDTDPSAQSQVPGFVLVAPARRLILVGVQNCVVVVEVRWLHSEFEGGGSQSQSCGSGAGGNRTAVAPLASSAPNDH